MDTESFLGSVGEFAGNFAPEFWADCNGQLLAITKNTALYSLLGITYGGDGVTTFAVPDLRPELNGEKVDWFKVSQPRKCICIAGVYPSHP